MKKVRELKKWNGRNCRGGSFCIAAYSQQQAAELLNKVSGTRGGTSEIKNYFSPTWGNDMNGIIPTEPCVYEIKENWKNQKPVKVYPTDATREKEKKEKEIREQEKRDAADQTAADDHLDYWNSQY